MSWFGRRRAREGELEEEIRAHFRLAVEERMARGESQADAERAVRREFGNELEVKEVTRAVWGGHWGDRLVQDSRYALRSLWRTPGFTVPTVLTLAVGIGATTAVFTVVNGVLFRPLPFPTPERLVLVAHGPEPGPFLATSGMADHDYVAFRDFDAGFAHLATFSNQPVALTGAGEPARLNAAHVTTEFFEVLGERQAHGRGFAIGEDVAGRDAVVVLGDALWRSRFAADPDVIGASIVLDGAMRTVVGVMPAGFDFPNRADLWLPLGIRLDPGNGRSRPVIARLRDGVSLEQSRAMFASFLATLPAPDGEVESSVQPLKAYFVNKVEHTLGVFMGAVAFVLLIACANVANLMLMRGAARDRELTVRSALGAGRARIMHQLLVESMVLALVGGAAGVLLARAGVDAFLMLIPSGRIPRADSIRIDGVVLGASAAVSLFVGIAFGLLPSLFATRRDLRGTLSVAALSSSRSRSRVRNLLVVGQISLALVLLTGAGLLLRSFRNMRAVDLGFTPANVLTMTVDLPTTTYARADAMQALHSRVLEQLQASSEVDAAGAVNWRPFGTMILSGDFAVENGPDLSSGYWAHKLAVSSDYFRAMGIRLLRGRSFTSGDLADAPGVVIVSRTVADRFWPDGEAVGGRLSLQTDPAPTDWLTVVGVVDDVLQSEITGTRAAAIYQPYPQVHRPFFLGRMSYFVRSTASPSAVAEAMRDAVRTADPNLPVHTVAAMDALVAAMTDHPRFQTWLLGTFALIALALAGIGVYGVLAYAVVQRRFEIGLRMALGARRSSVAGSVLRGSLLMTAVGVLLGAVGALVATHALRTWLFQVAPMDPAVFIAGAAILSLAALLAGWLPARRAAQVDPATVLKSDC